MTRIVSYNILAGGYSLRENGARRSPQLATIIRSAHSDIVGLAEAIHPHMTQRPWVVEEIAEMLGMQLIMGGEPKNSRDYRIALLTKLPVVYTKIHPRPTLLSRPLMEVCVEEENGHYLTVFLTHLSASFNRGRAGDHIRVREVREILNIMEPARIQDTPHLLMGDFNNLSPHEAFKASALLRYVVQLDKRRLNAQLSDGHPHLNSVVPAPLRFLNPALHIIARSDLLCSLFDAAAYLYAPRSCIRLLHEAGYLDCFRRAHPGDPGFTCPAAAPAGRIDYIFANSTLAERLSDCYIVTEGEGLLGSDASDHLAVAAEFGPGVQSVLAEAELDDTPQLKR